MRISRPEHPRFTEYKRFIAEHPNYSSLPNKISKDGTITWVKVRDAERTKWWDDRKTEMGAPDRATVARALHPKELGGYKPCQICGEMRSIFPKYPTTRALNELRKKLPDISSVRFAQEIDEIIEQSVRSLGDEGLEFVAETFKLRKIVTNADDLLSELTKSGRLLSPGAMSNAPDRLDGFHTYNGCCRAESDTGRHKSNLARYSTDRRAFESWASGNWRAADRLMGMFKNSSQTVTCPSCGQIRKMSADHLGPLSLGFSHRMSFRPMCQPCNSSRNNRMSFLDFKELIETEADGERVISWHSEATWHKLKVEVRDEQTATKASVLLRKNLHNVMSVLSDIYAKGHGEFLSLYLSPNYAHYEYEFENFDPATASFQVTAREYRSKNTERLSERYVRISFEALDSYADKHNRNTQLWEDAGCDDLLTTLYESLEQLDHIKASEILMQVFERFGELALQEFLSKEHIQPEESFPA